jgi:hypothetical protein
MPFDAANFKQRPADLEDFELVNERETLARVARILRGLEPPPWFNGKQIGFHMGEQCTVDEEALDYKGEACGTIACIGGHAWLLENPGDAKGAIRFVNTSAPAGLARLFWGTFSATPREAACAIDNYLETGQPNWNLARERAALEKVCSPQAEVK